MPRLLLVLAALLFALPAYAIDLPKGVSRDNALVIDTTKGRVVVMLRPDLAPNHVARLKQLARDGFYNNVPFHRVIDGFMAQTGDGARGDGMGQSQYPNLAAEFTATRFTRGVVGMARASDPNSANCQFFIMFDDGDFLNGKYTVVGRVVAGMENVDQLKRGEPVSDPDKMIKVQVVSDMH